MQRLQVSGVEGRMVWAEETVGADAWEQEKTELRLGVDFGTIGCESW